MSTEKTKKINILNKYLSLIIISFIIIASIAGLSVYFFINNNNINGAVLFEKAYDKLEKFEELPNIYSKQEMETELADAFNKVIINYPNTNAGKRALFYKGYVLYNTNNLEKAINALKIYISKYPNYYLTPKALYIISYCYSNTDKIDDAIKSLTPFESKYNTSYIKPLAIYRIAELYENKGENENAVKYYQKLLSESPNSIYKDFARDRIFLLKNNVEL